MKDISLVILCGGKGTRLGKLTKSTPKPFLNISHKKFLDYLIQFYQKYNFTKIYLLAGFKGHKIKNYYNNKFYNFLKIETVVEKKRLGTAGSIALLKKKIKSDFLLINGDSFLNYNFNSFINTVDTKYLGNIVLVKNNNYFENTKLIGLNLKRNNLVFHKKSSNLMNAGIYYFNKRIFNYVSLKYSSLEQLLNKLISYKKIKGFLSKDYFVDIGLKKNLLDAKTTLPKIVKKPAVFLDRDGVLNYNFGYVHKFKDFKWTPNAVEALKYLNKKGYYIFIITNQAGIARGYYTEDDFINLHKKIKKYLSKKNIFIEDVFFCPHHPTEGKGKYKINCDCRKPKNLLIENIKHQWSIDLKKSFMIGDQKTDALCAAKSKINFFYYKNNLLNQVKSIISRKK